MKEQTWQVSGRRMNIQQIICILILLSVTIQDKDLALEGVLDVNRGS